MKLSIKSLGNLLFLFKFFIFLSSLVPSSSSQMGYSASQLLNHNNQLEAEVARLTSALRAEQANTQIQLQRNATLAQEIR